MPDPQPTEPYGELPLLYFFNQHFLKCSNIFLVLVSLLILASFISCLFFLKSYLFIYLFRATPEAFGCSQAKGQIGAVAAGLHHSHSNVGTKLRL